MNEAINCLSCGKPITIDNHKSRIEKLCPECENDTAESLKLIENQKQKLGLLPRIDILNFPCSYCGAQSTVVESGIGIVPLDLLSHEEQKAFHYKCDRCHFLERKLWHQYCRSSESRWYSCKREDPNEAREAALYDAENLRKEIARRIEQK